MRNLYIKLLSVLILGLLGASSASAGPAAFFAMAAANANSTNTTKEESSTKQKEDTSSRITCVPQGTPQQQLWTCQDAYGNQYPDMVITLKSEIDRLKNGNSKRAGK